MAIKMVAIDIDGTLINDKREITPGRSQQLKGQPAGRQNRPVYWPADDGCHRLPETAQLERPG
jgi:Predicted hydrolases of the HAD superfamily